MRPPCFQTTHLEGAIQALADQYKFVVVQRTYATESPIWLQDAAVQGHRIWRYKPWLGKQMDDHLVGWREAGGILYNYSRFGNQEVGYGKSEAIVFVECPMTQYQLEVDLRRVSNIAVFYRPPSWNEHRKTVAHRAPHPDEVESVYRFVLDEVGKPFTDQIVSALMVNGIYPGNRSAVLDDHAIAKACGLDVMVTRGCLRALVKFVRTNAVPGLARFVPLIEPDQPLYVEMYRFIEGQQDMGGGLRIISTDRMFSFSRKWKVITKKMRRAGWISQRPTLSIYQLRNRALDLELIAKAHRTEQNECQCMIEFIEGLPVFET